MTLKAALAALVFFWSASCVAGVPVATTLTSHTDHYFHQYYGEGKEMLWLKRNGSYSITEVENGSLARVIDRGRWMSVGGHLSLSSEKSLVSIQMENLDVSFIGGPCALRLMSTLRRQIAAAKALPIKYHAKAWSEQSGGAIFSVDAPDIAVTRHVCNISVQKRDAPVDATWLQKLSRALDDYVAHIEEQSRFDYDVYTYRGRVFLLPAKPGEHLWPEIPSIKGIAADIDAHRMEDYPFLPGYTYFDITRTQFVEWDACDFPSSTTRCAED